MEESSESASRELMYAMPRDVLQLVIPRGISSVLLMRRRMLSLISLVEGMVTEMAREGVQVIRESLEVVFASFRL